MVDGYSSGRGPASASGLRAAAGSQGRRRHIRTPGTKRGHARPANAPIRVRDVTRQYDREPPLQNSGRNVLFVAWSKPAKTVHCLLPSVMYAESPVALYAHPSNCAIWS